LVTPGLARADFPGQGQPRGVPSPSCPGAAAQWYPQPGPVGSTSTVRTPWAAQGPSGPGSEAAPVPHGRDARGWCSPKGIRAVQEGPSPGELRDGVMEKGSGGRMGLGASLGDPTGRCGAAGGRKSAAASTPAAPRRFLSGPLSRRGMGAAAGAGSSISSGCGLASSAGLTKRHERPSRLPALTSSAGFAERLVFVFNLFAVGVKLPEEGAWLPARYTARLAPVSIRPPGHGVGQPPAGPTPSGHPGGLQGTPAHRQRMAPGTAGVPWGSDAQLPAGRRGGKMEPWGPRAPGAHPALPRVFGTRCGRGTRGSDTEGAALPAPAPPRCRGRGTSHQNQGFSSGLRVFSPDKNHRVTASLRLEKTLKITKSSCHPNPPTPAQPHPAGPHPHGV